LSGWCDWKFGSLVPTHKESSSSCWSFTTCNWIAKVLLAFTLLPVLAQSPFSQYNCLLQDPHGYPSQFIYCTALPVQKAKEKQLCYWVNLQQLIQIAR